MRTIKSQDGKMIVNAEKVNRFCVDKIEEAYEKNFCLWRIYVIFDVWTKIAEYSTEKRALRVLDMLNEWLTEYSTPDLDCPSSLNFEKHRIWWKSFQLPEDSEELDV